MITFTSLDSATRVSGGAKDLIVYPADAKKAVKDNVIVLSASPEEQSTDGVVSWPGEYNVGGVSLKGIGHEDGRQVSFVVDIDGVRCALLSSPLQDWTDYQLEAVGDIDVLLIPTSDAKLVQKLVDEFDPRVLILQPTKEKDAHGAVLKAFGAKEKVSEYKLKSSLPAEGREVVVLA